MAQKQIAPTGKWFYKDTDKRREFTQIVCLGCNDTPYNLCTDEEKEKYTAERKELYPEYYPQEQPNEA